MTVIAALGALLAGASAVRAVMIAGRVDSACGRGVDAVDWAQRQA